MAELLHPTQIPKILAQYLQDAERLIDVANESVGSFFVSKDTYTKKSGKNFIGFLQDSLVDDKDFRISTGGLSVADYLCQVEPYLEYLHSNGITSLKRLRTQRNDSRKYVMENASSKSFAKSVSFKTLSPLTYSICASLGNAGENTKTGQERACFFNMVNLNYFLGGSWPRFENVDKPHPLIAYKVQGGVSMLTRGSTNGLKHILKRPARFFSDSFKKFGVSQPTSKPLNVTADIPRNGADADEIAKKIRTAHTLFRRQAEQYLWEQIGYAPSSDAITDSSLLYDPVGACYALNILLDSAECESADGDAQRVLGEHITLIARSIDHILSAVTSSGVFPYGVPFSYNTNGTAGFATSVNGLSSLARFLVKILRRARELNYPSEQFFEHLLTDNFGLLEKLFSLASLFSNSRRSLEITKQRCGFLNGNIALLGWSTDRAPNNSRIESWVTIEVLLFAIYLREALQEFAQFIVCRKYSAKMPRFVEPLWPYVRTTKASMTTHDKKPLFIDPDEQELQKHKRTRSGPKAAMITSQDLGAGPVQFLHTNFSQFMTDEHSMRVCSDWKQEVSSVLLFGPPGAAKSTMAISLAQALGWHYLELSPSNFIINGLETIEQKAKEIFEELGMLREAVILFDELDSLFVDRELLKPDSIINFLVPAMLPKIQTLSKRAKKQRLLIVIATNFYDRLDPAMVRRGRIDKHLLVLPYNDRSRTRQLGSLLKDSPKVMDSKRFIEKFNTSTRLYVFEELNAVSRVIEDRAEKWTNKADFEFDEYSPSAINPSIYWSRLPPDGIAVSRVRSTQRLALEVCEVGGRLLNEKRNLASSSERDTIAKRLAELEEKLSMAGHTEWSSLCKKLGFRLRSVQPDTEP